MTLYVSELCELYRKIHRARRDCMCAHAASWGGPSCAGKIWSAGHSEQDLGAKLTSVDAHVIIAIERVAYAASCFGRCHSCCCCNRHRTSNLATKCTANPPACCTTQRKSECLHRDIGISGSNCRCWDCWLCADGPTGSRASVTVARRPANGPPASCHGR